MRLVSLFTSSLFVSKSSVNMFGYISINCLTRSCFFNSHPLKVQYLCYDLKFMCRPTIGGQLASSSKMSSILLTISRFSYRWFFRGHYTYSTREKQLLIKKLNLISRLASGIFIQVIIPLSFHIMINKNRY